MKLSIIIPTYNEQTTIRELVQAVQAVHYPIEHEIIIIDDASVDRTYEKAMLLRLREDAQNIRIFKNRINRGKGFSIRKGIKRAQGDILVIQDADNEYDPQDIPRLVDLIIKGETSVAYGSRFLNCSHPKGMKWLNRLANKILTAMTNLLFGTHLTDMETCYKVFRSDVIKTLSLRQDRFAFEPEVTALVVKRGISIKELPIRYDGRTSKKGKKIKARDFFFAVATLIRCKWFRQK